MLHCTRIHDQGKVFRLFGLKSAIIFYNLRKYKSRSTFSYFNKIEETTLSYIPIGRNYLGEFNNFFITSRGTETHLNRHLPVQGAKGLKPGRSLAFVEVDFK